MGFAVSSDNTDVAAKAFIVHNNAGGRVSCGLLSSDTTTSTTVVTVSTTVTTTAATTTTTITTATVASGHEAYHAYTASLAPLSNSGVSGEVAIFVTGSGLVGVGSAIGLEANLVASPSGMN